MVLVVLRPGGVASDPHHVVRRHSSVLAGHWLQAGPCRHQPEALYDRILLAFQNGVIGYTNETITNKTRFCIDVDGISTRPGPPASEGRQ